MRAVHMLAICAMATIGSAANAQEIDWKKVDETIGRSAAVVSGDVHRYGFPRTDLTVTLDGVTIRPALATSTRMKDGKKIPIVETSDPQKPATR